MDVADHESIRPTSAELGFLWNTYMIESLVHHVFSYYHKHAEDKDIKEILSVNIGMTRDSLDLLTAAISREKMPVPRGITSEDIELDAPRLFSDKYYALYLKNMARLAATNYSLAYSQSSRKDIRKFFQHYVSRLALVDEQVTELMLAKGIYTRPPAIPIPDNTDFVKNMSFFSGFPGKKRPLTALEISHLFLNAEANSVGQVLLTGFSQTAQSPGLKQYFARGKAIANKFVRLFNGVLLSGGLSTAPTLDSELMASTVAPFSDRLMLFHTNLLNAASFGNYGMAFSASPRHDLALLYVRVLLQVGFYSKTGANLSVKYGWQEQPPSAPDREALSRYSGEKTLLTQPAMKPIDEGHDDDNENKKQP